MPVAAFVCIGSRMSRLAANSRRWHIFGCNAWIDLTSLYLCRPICFGTSCWFAWPNLYAVAQGTLLYILRSTTVPVDCLRAARIKISASVSSYITLSQHTVYLHSMIEIHWCSSWAYQTWCGSRWTLNRATHFEEQMHANASRHKCVPGCTVHVFIYSKKCLRIWMPHTVQQHTCIYVDVLTSTQHTRM